MKTLLLLMNVVMISVLTHAQTIIFDEDFESGGAGITMNTTDVTGTATGDNPWTLNNIYAGGSGTFFCPALGFTFPFTVPAAPIQPAGITNSPTSTYLHVTPQIALDAGGTLPAASFVVADGFCLFGGQSTFTRMSSDISTLGHDSVTLDLWWMCGGSTAYYGEVYYSTNGGGAWTAVNNPISGTNEWRAQTTWVNSVFTNANWDGQSTLRFGFRFVSSSAGTGSDLDPGFAIDDIVVTGYDLSSCTPTASNISPTACDSYTSPSGNYTHTSSLTFNDTIPNMAGCDSVITINLTINSVDESVNQTAITLSAVTGSATYQWLDCNNAYAIIPGATSQNYIAAANGDYALKITANGCTDTSACFVIDEVGISESNSFINLFPNPATNYVTVNTGQISAGLIVITDVLGREVLNIKLQSSTTEISLQSLEPGGTYFVRVLNTDGEILGVEKLIVR